MGKIADRILANTLVDSLIKLLQRSSFPGFLGVPNWDVIVFFWRETQRDRITVRSAAMAFNFLLALFPAMLFLFTLIPYIPVEDLELSLLNLIAEFLPFEAMKFVEDMIWDIVSRQRFDLLSFGFVLAFYFATNGVTSMMTSFNKDQPTFRKRNFWQQRAAAIRLLVYIIILFLGSIILILYGREIVTKITLRYHLSRQTMFYIFSILRWVIIFILYFSTIAFIYHYAPATHKKWRFISPGSTLATILSISATLGFAYFANRFGMYNQIYGSLGALIVLMIWININTFVLLVGFELNNSIDMNKRLIMTDLDESPQ